jgi:hypothetical protein
MYVGAYLYKNWQWRCAYLERGSRQKWQSNYFWTNWWWNGSRFGHAEAENLSSGVHNFSRNPGNTLKSWARKGWHDANYILRAHKYQVSPCKISLPWRTAYQNLCTPVQVKRTPDSQVWIDWPCSVIALSGLIFIDDDIFLLLLYSEL